MEYPFTWAGKKVTVEYYTTRTISRKGVCLHSPQDTGDEWVIDFGWEIVSINPNCSIFVAIHVDTTGEG